MYVMKVEMLSDTELLKLAAKAAGVPIHRFDRDGNVVPEPGNGHCRSVTWNPLVNDGDAFRLAARLSMQVSVDRIRYFETHAMPAYGTEDTCAFHHGGDFYAATRRAIVIAAAKLGEKIDAAPGQ